MPFTWLGTVEYSRSLDYLLVAYIDPPVSLDDLETMGVVNGHPPQSIYRLDHDLMVGLVARSNLSFDVCTRRG